MSNFFARVGSADAYASAINNIGGRQSRLTQLQSNLTAGKRVLKPSDDPTAAAQAERAITRSAQVTIQQRALSLQKDNMSQAETVLGQASDAIQSFRELLVQAGNGANTASDLGTITSQLTTLRNQLLTYANSTDANGQALFGGLGSTNTPFIEPNGTAGVVFAGLGGQTNGTDLTIPNTIDGQAAFANVTPTTGAFAISAQSGNTGTATASAGTILIPTSPNVLAGNSYQINFTSGTTYTVTDLSVSPPTTSGSLTMAGSTVKFGGAGNVDQQMTLTGTPAAGDSFTVKPKASIFDVMDSAIAGIKNASSGTSAQASVSGSLAALDNAYVSVQAARGLAGDYLNQADVIDSNQQTKAVQLEGDRSRAEDLDMLQGISDFQNQTTGYQAALKSYAQIQSMSLFDFLK